MLIPSAIYISWDIFFTHIGVWNFNPQFILGFNLINLPVEEVLFFFVVPYCCVFIYECIRCYFPLMKDTKAASLILKGIGIILFLAGLFFFDRSYTGYTFLFVGTSIAIFFLLRKYFIHFHVAAFLVSFLISLIPFLLVNGLLTAMPVVQYNNEENLGIRIYTIPFEDVFYGMLLLMLNIAGFEKLRNNKKRS